MTEDSNAWVFDSLICFLHGPIWNAPLQTFIEEKSLIFDPNEKLDEENEDYKKIHEEYKNLVDFMLGSFMEEMHITPEQFEVACLTGRHGQNKNTLNFHQGLFQQIWAANDIRIFIRMMTQRNVELQLQVLDVIERRPNNSTSSQEGASSSSINETAKEMAASADEVFNDDVTQEEIEKMVANEVAEKVLIESDDKQLGDKAEALPDEHDVSDQFQRLNLYFDEHKVDSADLKSRQEYLRAQRDKILALKKKVRTQQLNENLKKNGGRPTSARAAQKVLAADGHIMDEPNQASLKLRKTLAKRLRNEVVDTDE